MVSFIYTLHNVCAVHWGMFSTLGDIIEYTGGCSIHWGDIIGTLGVFSTVGDTMSAVGDAMMSVRDIMSTPGLFSTLGLSYKFNCLPNERPPHLS